MRLKFYIALVLGAGLLACSDAYEITVSSDQIEVNDAIDTDAGIDSLIGPYRQEMTAKMSDVLAYAKNDFTKDRPNGALNNWSADAILNHQILDNEGMERPGPFMCLLNVGGLRNPISKGQVTVGDIYKLMPFDNEVVWVEMPWETISDIADYLNKSGGEPISGAMLEGDTLLFNGWDTPQKTYWIITSDYLMNGGDKMTFFEKKLSYEYAGILMRDAMIEQATLQDTLVFDDQPRINL